MIEKTCVIGGLDLPEKAQHTRTVGTARKSDEKRQGSDFFTKGRRFHSVRAFL